MDDAQNSPTTYYQDRHGFSTGLEYGAYPAVLCRQPETWSWKSRNQSALWMNLLRATLRSAEDGPDIRQLQVLRGQPPNARLGPSTLSPTLIWIRDRRSPWFYRRGRPQAYSRL